jgi:hypothetical protein
MKINRCFASGLLSTLVPGVAYLGYLTWNEWGNPYYWSRQFPAYLVVILVIGLAMGAVALRIGARTWQILLCGSVSWIASLPLSIGILGLVWAIPGWLCPQACVHSSVLQRMEDHIVILHAGIWMIVGAVLGITLLMFMRRVVKLRTPLQFDH